MLRRLRPRFPSHATVVAYLGLFVALGGTSAYAINEWNSSNIQNETLLSEDIKNGTLQAADYGIGSVSGARIQDNNVTTLDLADGAIFGNDIRDGSLNDEDVGEGTSVDFELNVGTVAAGFCKNITIGAVGATGDHLLLTPNFDTSSSSLAYGIEYYSEEGSANVKVCNPGSININDGTTSFNLIVIDAH